MRHFQPIISFILSDTFVYGQLVPQTFDQMAYNFFLKSQIIYIFSNTWSKMQFLLKTANLFNMQNTWRGKGHMYIQIPTYNFGQMQLSLSERYCWYQTNIAILWIPTEALGPPIALALRSEISAFCLLSFCQNERI